ncbi:MAG: 30S ribosomal protein S6 [Nitrospirae bacterium]|nr:30S ribosomal protein S6 [Nitrospirota bacterium]MCL5238142.1 30S ribosomal protein S6 [Nitrospirota bacterium]
MNVYENMVILNPSLNDEEIKSAVDKISDLIANSGGEVLKAENWGRRKLAYELNRQKMGLYVFFLFKAPSATVKKIEDYFKVFDPVLKFMVIKLGSKQIAALPKEVAGAPAQQETTQAAEQKAAS